MTWEQEGLLLESLSATLYGLSETKQAGFHLVKGISLFKSLVRKLPDVKPSFVDGGVLL